MNFKTIFFAAIAVFSLSNLAAQNVQLHYDFGHEIHSELLQDRPLTTTVEMFKPDKLGSTFFFVDMDYTSKGVQSAYWEISREFNIKNTPFAAHIEYNGGLNTFTSFENSYLIGPSLNLNDKTFSKGISFQLLYKYIQGTSTPNNMQFTTVWYAHFLDKKLSFNGFADLWSTSLQKNKNFIFITEPQLWLNLNAFQGIPKDFNLSIGTELEMSCNFWGFNPIFKHKFFANPTLALKWTF